MAEQIYIGSFRASKYRRRRDNREIVEYKIYLPRRFVEEGSFPFKPGEKIILKKEKDRVIAMKLKVVNHG